MNSKELGFLALKILAKQACYLGLRICEAEIVESQNEFERYVEDRLTRSVSDSSRILIDSRSEAILEEVEALSGKKQRRSKNGKHT